MFTIPATVGEYNNKVNSVFDDVSHVCKQLSLYRIVEKHVVSGLGEEIEQVVVGIVKLCAHVVVYQRGSTWKRFKKQLSSLVQNQKSAFENDLSEFKVTLERLKNFESTATFMTVTQTHDVSKKTYKEVNALLMDRDRDYALKEILERFDISAGRDFSVRHTPLCAEMSNNCHNGSGAWIWGNPAYMSWTSPEPPVRAPQF